MRSGDHSFRVRAVAAALVLASTLSFEPAAAEAADAKHVGIGAACVLSNLLYGPAKITLALIGSLTAGLGYAVTAGDTDVARKIFDSSVMGDYVVLPEHIEGQKTLEFIGQTTPQTADDWSAPTSNSGF